MQVIINGESRQIDENISLGQFLVELGVDTAQVAVERNGEIVAKSTYNKVMLAPSDKLELVRFIGGG